MASVETVAGADKNTGHQGQENKSHNEDARFGTEDAIRIVLIGRTGNGKSATGNSIVKRKNCFTSRVSSKSVTEVCERGEVERDGKTVVVVDSPGLFDTTKNSEIIRKEVIKCISVSSPGPHAILYVLSCRARFTKEEEDTFAEMITMFGEDLYKYIIFIFTAFDDIQGENKTFEDFLNDSKDMFKTLFQKSGNRVLAFNNSVASDDAENERQLQSLFAMITNMNGGNPKLYYQNEMLKNAEQVIEQQMKKIIEEKIKKGEKCDNLEAIRAVVRSQIRDDILREGSMFQSIKQLFFGSKYWYAAGAGAVGVGAVLLRSTQCAIM